MKRKWFPVLFLPLLLAAEDFEAYPDTTALRRVWQEFDAGNPAPDTVAIGALNGKAMQVTAAHDYSILWRELANPFGAKAARDQAGRERRRRESGGRGADRGGAPRKKAAPTSAAW